MGKCLETCPENCDRLLHFSYLISLNFNDKVLLLAISISKLFWRILVWWQPSLMCHSISCVRCHWERRSQEKCIGGWRVSDEKGQRTYAEISNDWWCKRPRIVCGIWPRSKQTNKRASHRRGKIHCEKVRTYKRYSYTVAIFITSLKFIGQVEN